MQPGRLGDPQVGPHSRRLQVSICLVLALSLSSLTDTQAETVDLKSSTQFLWGDDWLGEGQSIIAQYMRFGYEPDGKNFSMTGYGRVWEDFTDSQIQDDDLSGRLYYLYMNYSPFENTALRLGRQFVNLTAGSSLMDGLSLDVSSLGPVGITVAGGTDVRLSLDGTHSELGDYFVGFNVHLENVRATQLGIGYVRRYDEYDRAREEFGLNFRRSWAYISPYGEIRYDWLSEAVDEAVLGLDVFPLTNLMIKGEYYHSYPTFDSTSIFSVFAVDPYREYLLQAEYSLEAPVTLFASYTKQTYEDDDDADLYSAGASVYPTGNLTLKVSIDRRTGFGGKDWGFESSGDYRIKDKFILSAGAEYDNYERPDEFSENYATRYWLGGRWHFRKDASVTARFEDNINENFDRRPLGRIILDWQL